MCVFFVCMRLHVECVYLRLCTLFTHALLLCVHAHIDVVICICLCIFGCAGGDCVCVCLCTCTCVHMHVHTRTCTPLRISLSVCDSMTNLHYRAHLLTCRGAKVITIDIAMVTVDVLFPGPHNAETGAGGGGVGVACGGWMFFSRGRVGDTVGR